MSLLTQTVLDLAPASGLSEIDRFLPEPYRRTMGEGDDPMAALTKTARVNLKRARFEMELIQKSRSVAFFNDLADGRALGAMHDQSPWPEEDKDEFRARLTSVAALALQGAASARRLLELCALATSANIVKVIQPDQSTTVKHKNITLKIKTENGQTRGYLSKNTPGQEHLFAVDILDAPLREYVQQAIPFPGQTHFVFSLNNQASKTLPARDGEGERLYPDPKFEISADQDFGPFMLIQQNPAKPNHAPRIICINRRLPAGSTIEIDVAKMEWRHVHRDVVTLQSWITCRGVKQALYAGLSEITTPANIMGLSKPQRIFDNEIDNHNPSAGYALDIRNPAELVYFGFLTDQMIDKGGIPQTPGSVLQMPSLLGLGMSEWRVAEIAKPITGSETDIHSARFNPAPANAPIRITARWFGRRAGEFAVRLDEPLLAEDQSGPLPHRTEWLDAMIDRFKLAGTIRVKAAEIDADKAWPPEASEIQLTSNLHLTDTMSVNAGLDIFSHIVLGDSVLITSALEISFTENVQINADIQLSLDGHNLHFTDIVSLVDRAVMTSELSFSSAESITLTSRIDMQQAGLTFGFSEAVSLSDRAVMFTESQTTLPSMVRVSASMSIENLLKTAAFDDKIALGDAAEIKGEFRISRTSSAKLGDSMKISLTRGE